MADEERATLLSEKCLPPLPTPNHARQGREWLRGCTTVMSLIAFFVGTAELLLTFVRPDTASVPSEVSSLITSCLYVEAIAALACLLALRWSNPGIIERDPSAPIPEEIYEKLLAGEALPATNVVDTARGSFCVRCLVWRKSAGSHHCSICQRCVSDFSHHCSFFGRCIAGRGLRGNRAFFRSIIAVGNLAAATYAVAIAAVAYYSSWPIVTLLTLLGVAYVMYFLSAGGWSMTIMLMRFWLIRRCPRSVYTALCEDEPPPMPPTPMVVAQLGPCCGGRFLSVTC